MNRCVIPSDAHMYLQSSTRGLVLTRESSITGLHTGRQNKAGAVDALTKKYR